MIREWCVLRVGTAGITATGGLMYERFNDSLGHDGVGQAFTAKVPTTVARYQAEVMFEGHR